MADIIFRNVTKTYDDKVVLDNMSLDFPETGFVCIIGPSGSGKTTIMNLLLGLQKPDSGEVRLQVPGKASQAPCPHDSQDFVEASQAPCPCDSVSVVFQEDRLLPWESVLENVLLPCDTSKNNKDAARDKAVRILTELGLGEELDTFPDELSGGMARRVSIARALAVDADIYLMDEPTKGLDDETRQETLNIIRKYTQGRLLIMITHNPDETRGAHVISLM